MFCFNCGGKVPDGARFCSNCGTNLSSVSGGTQEIQEMPAVSQEPMNAQHDEETISPEKAIEFIFADIFKGRRQFGEQVYIIGKDPITQEMKENLQEYYLSGDPAEKPLLAFNYGKELLEGFVITNQRLVWYFGTSGQSEIELTDIKEALIGKAVLATVMNVVSFENIKYKNIYLTGIHNETEFVLKFRKFIDTIYDVFYGSDDEEDYDNEEYEITEQRHDTDFIIRACERSNINSMYCEIGQPTILPTSKKYANAKMNFRIPDSEDIFLIYDSTVFGGCRKGFAICTTGLYYCESRLGYLDWNQFKAVDISHGFTGLKIGSELFNADGKDGKNLLMILRSIQEYL